MASAIFIYPLKLRIYFFENPPGIFRFFTLPLEILDKTKLNPWIFHKIVSDPFFSCSWKFPKHIQGQKQRPLEVPCHIIYFLDTLGSSTSFLINPWKFHIFENSGLEFFIFFTLPLEIPNKTKLNLLAIFHKIVLDPLEIPRPKANPWKFHTHSPGNSTCCFFDTPGNSISSFHISGGSVWIFS